MIIDINKRPDSGTPKSSDATATDAAETSAQSAQQKPETLSYYACIGHDSAYRSLLDGLRRQQGCIVFSGEAGVGKTLILRKLLKEASSPFNRIVYCPSAAIEFDQLVSFIGDKLELPMPSAEPKDRLAVFKNYLRACTDANIGFTLIIDEAQLLRDELVERLFTLPELSQCLVSVVLSARPDLLDRLAGWRRRYSFIANALLVSLPCLSDAEAKIFIQHNLQAAQFPLKYSMVALERIAHQTQGRPRAIDTLCRQTLAIARRNNSAEITEAIIEQAVAQLEKGQPGLTPLLAPRSSVPSSAPRHSARFSMTMKPMMNAILSVMMLVVGGWLFVKYDGSSDVSPSVAPTMLLSTPQTAAPTAAAANKAPVAAHPVGLNRSQSVASAAPQTLAAPQKPVTEQAVDSPTQMTDRAQKPAVPHPETEAPALPTELAAVQPRAHTAAPPPAVQESAVLDAELQLWERIQDSRDSAAYKAYLDAYPQGRFAKLAELRLQRLSQQREDELNALLTKSQSAFDKKALTTPEQDNAAKWARAALQIDPGNQQAYAMLYDVLDTYIDWAVRNLERRRLNNAASYLQRAQGLEDYAKPEQRAALDVLNKQVLSERQRLAKQQAKRSRPRTARASPKPTRPRSSPRSNTVSYGDWLQQLDFTMQSIGREIDRAMGTHGRTTVDQDDLSGFQNR